MKKLLEVGDTIQWTIVAAIDGNNEQDGATIVRVNQELLDLRRTSNGQLLCCNIASTADSIPSECIIEMLEERIERFTGRSGYDMICDLARAVPA